MPPSYYAKAFRLFDRNLGSQTTIRHCMQTNGVLIDETWCAFFKAHQVSVGVSLDGPQWIHDRNRRTRSGEGTFIRVMNGIDCLRKTHVPFHVIAVLSLTSLDYADDIFDFFISENIRRVGFNIEEKEAANTSSSLEDSSAREHLKTFFHRMIELNDRTDNPLHIREVTGMTGAMLGDVPEHEKHQQSTPFKILTIAHDGSVSTFSPELMGSKSDKYGDFIFGNIATHDLGQILNSENFQQVKRDVDQGVARCKDTCGYFKLCGGGAPGNKFFEYGTFDATETLYCKLTVKAVADAVLERLEADIHPPVHPHEHCRKHMT